MRNAITIVVATCLLGVTGCGFVVVDESDSGSESGNEAPRAQLSVDPASPTVGEEVIFSGAGSSDPDGDDLRYVFDVRNYQGDRVFYKEGAASSARYTFEETGVKTVALEVHDGRGNSASTRATIDVRSGSNGGGDETNEKPVVDLSWTLYRDGSAVGSGSVDDWTGGDADDGFYASGGDWDRLVLQVDRIRDPEGHETSVRWEVRDAPSGYSRRCSACSGMTYTLHLTKSGYYEGAGVIVDEKGAKVEYPFSLEVDK